MNKNIQMVDLVAQYQSVKSEIDTAIQNILDNGIFIKGEEIKSFEAELAEYVDVKHVISCANGTDALQIAMMALDLKPGDEVIVPSFTYVATAEVIALLKLVPVFVDVDPITFGINNSQIEDVITPKTKAIVPVHLYGQCSDMEPLLNIAQKHNLFIIEDTAQAIGAVYSFSDGTKKQAGTMGTIGTTSFFPSKNLGCYGDGGALFTNDDLLAKKIRMIANHGQEKQYYHDVVGVNSRLDTLQAAILRVKLRNLDAYSQARNSVANQYDIALKNDSRWEIPNRAKNSTHVFHQYTLKLQNINRDHLKAYLSDHGIPSMVYYPLPLHLQKAYASYPHNPEFLMNSSQLSEQVISLPIHTELDKLTTDYITQILINYHS